MPLDPHVLAQAHAAAKPATQAISGFDIQALASGKAPLTAAQDAEVKKIQTLFDGADKPGTAGYEAFKKELQHLETLPDKAPVIAALLLHAESSPNQGYWAKFPIDICAYVPSARTMLFKGENGKPVHFGEILQEGIKAGSHTLPANSDGAADWKYAQHKADEVRKANHLPPVADVNPTPSGHHR